MFHLDLQLWDDMLPEDNETQISYPYIWRQTILELDDPPSALELPLVSSSSFLLELYDAFWLFQRNLCYWKWLGFWQILNEFPSAPSLAASTPSIMLELILKPFIIFRAGPGNRSIGMIVNNCWMFCLCVFLLFLREFIAISRCFHGRCSFVNACVFRMKPFTASTDVL